MEGMGSGARDVLPCRARSAVRRPDSTGGPVPVESGRENRSVRRSQVWQRALDLHRSRSLAAIAGRHRRRLQVAGQSPQPGKEVGMRFSPEYVACVLHTNFEDAKTLFLAPLMRIHYAHLVMLADRGIIPVQQARTVRDALDSISMPQV